MRNLILLVLTLVLLPISATAGKNRREQILTVQTITTAGGKVESVITSGSNGRAYLIIEVTSAGGTPSLLPKARLFSGNTIIETICTLNPPITVDGIYVYLVGSTATAAGSVDGVCDFRVGMQTSWEFTVSGAGGTMDVEAWLEWLSD